MFFSFCISLSCAPIKNTNGREREARQESDEFQIPVRLFSRSRFRNSDFAVSAKTTTPVYFCMLIDVMLIKKKSVLGSFRNTHDAKYGKIGPFFQQIVFPDRLKHVTVEECVLRKLPNQTLKPETKLKYISIAVIFLRYLKP